MPTTYTIRTVSGRTKTVSKDFYQPENIVGLDPEGRVVVDNFGTMAKPYEVHPLLGAPFLFALTLCCNASDKGVEDGVVCRACYSYEETGGYLYMRPDGSFPELDPIVERFQAVER